MRAAIFNLVAFSMPGKADMTVVQNSEGAMNAGQLTLRIKGNKARADVSQQNSMITD